MRELNRLRLLQELRDATVADRGELARRTGLSRATISSLVGDCIASGAIAEQPAPDPGGSAGRPSSPLRLDPRAAAVLGIDFGHRHVRVAVADLAGAILAERRVDLDVHAGAHAALDTTTALVTPMLAETGFDRRRVLGAALGLPAPVNARTGTVQNSAILAEWESILPGPELEQRLGVPVATANDADLGALGEFAYGAGRGIEDLLYVKVSTGIGAGLILGGALHTGATGIAGEIGHLGVDPEGVICICGNRGCLETVACADALRRAVAPVHGRGITLRQLLKLAGEGDRSVHDAVASAGGLIGDALAALCTGLNPAAIVIGGELGAECEPLRAAIEETIRARALPPTGDVPVLRASLGERAEVLGATALVLAHGEWLRAAGLVALVDGLATVTAGSP
jgi:predicted NBD/HSP70 family sugar kinase